jgi:hypothetical protein
MSAKLPTDIKPVPCSATLQATKKSLFFAAYQHLPPKLSRQPLNAVSGEENQEAVLLGGTA